MFGEFVSVLAQCQGVLISNNLRGATVAAGFKAVSKLSGVHHSTVREIIRKWKTFDAVANLLGKWTFQRVHPKVRLYRLQLAC